MKVGDVYYNDGLNSLPGIWSRVGSWPYTIYGTFTTTSGQKYDYVAVPHGRPDGSHMIHTGYKIDSINQR
jgi:hypothetical protein